MSESFLQAVAIITDLEKSSQRDEPPLHHIAHTKKELLALIRQFNEKYEHICSTEKFPDGREYEDLSRLITSVLRNASRGDYEGRDLDYVSIICDGIRPPLLHKILQNSNVDVAQVIDICIKSQPEYSGRQPEDLVTVVDYLKYVCDTAKSMWTYHEGGDWSLPPSPFMLPPSPFYLNRIYHSGVLYHFTQSGKDRSNINQKQAVQSAFDFRHKGIWAIEDILTLNRPADLVHHRCSTMNSLIKGQRYAMHYGYVEGGPLRAGAQWDIECEQKIVTYKLIELGYYCHHSMCLVDPFNEVDKCLQDKLLLRVCEAVISRPKSLKVLSRDAIRNALGSGVQILSDCFKLPLSRQLRSYVSLDTMNAGVRYHVPEARTTLTGYEHYSEVYRRVLTLLGLEEQEEDQKFIYR